MRDELFLYVGGRRMHGWSSIRVTCGIERCPNDFEIEMTELYPDDIGAAEVRPGDFCEVRLGTPEKNDSVVTGYIDRYTPSIGPGYHTIQVSGRGKCQDLVDCSAEWPGGQISASNILEIARNLAGPYGLPDDPIHVKTDVLDLGPRIQQFNLMLGETPMDIIERCCRYAGLLAYEDAEGNLLLTRAGHLRAASGFYQAITGDTSGNNVQSASITYSMDQRYSGYLSYIQAVDTFEDVGEGGNLVAYIGDNGVPRYRQKITICESGESGLNIAERRIIWERNRRYGRSACLNLTTDTWRDADGYLWTPNTLVDLFLPALKASNVTWLISEVTYKRDGISGTTAELKIMPPEAFGVQPTLQMPTFADIPAHPAK